MGRFISPDTIIPNPASPQAFNRYSYCLNNPLKYVDPSGHDPNYWAIIEEAEKQSRGEQVDIEKVNDILTNSGSLLSPMPEFAFDNTALTAGIGTVVFLVADDLTGVGILDDVLIPLVIIGAGIATIATNWDYISHEADALKAFLFAKAHGEIPSKKDGYEPPKNWNGKKVNNPNGSGSGYPDKHGNVWVPNSHKGTHAPHWDVQHPGKGYTPVYPK